MSSRRVLAMTEAAPSFAGLLLWLRVSLGRRYRVRGPVRAVEVGGWPPRGVGTPDRCPQVTGWHRGMNGARTTPQKAG